jgi:hypothetical protein
MAPTCVVTIRVCFQRAWPVDRGVATESKLISEDTFDITLGLLLVNPININQEPVAQGLGVCGFLS